jgi:hypothetical protein
MFTFHPSTERFDSVSMPAQMSQASIDPTYENEELATVHVKSDISVKLSDSARSHASSCRLCVPKCQDTILDKSSFTITVSIHTVFVCVFMVFVFLLGFIISAISTKYSSDLVALQVETIDQMQNLILNLANQSKSELRHMFDTSTSILVKLIIERVISRSSSIDLCSFFVLFNYCDMFNVAGQFSNANCN